MISRIALAVMLMVWALGCFWGGLYLTFPSDAARDRMVYEVDNSTNSQNALRLDSVRPWLLTGAHLSNVQLFSIPKTRNFRRTGDVQEPTPKLLLKAEKAAARLRLLPLLSGTRSVGLSADLYGGDLGGTVGVKGSKVELDLLAKELDLAQYPLEGASWSAELEGRLRARVDLKLDQEDTRSGRGFIRFEFSDLKVNSANVMGMDLGEATFSEGLLSFTVANGRAEVKKGQFTSDKLSLKLDGSINVNKPFSRSRLDLDMEVTLADELDAMASILPRLKDARDDAGVFHFSCSGIVERPVCREKRQSSGRSRSTRSPSTASSSRSIGRDSGTTSVKSERSDEDMDQRRKDREERIKERRERIKAEREARLKEREMEDDELDDDELDDEEFMDDEDMDDDFEPNNFGAPGRGPSIPVGDMPEDMDGDILDGEPPDLPYLDD